jgi:hypothetical protein
MRPTGKTKTVLDIALDGPGRSPADADGYDEESDPGEREPDDDYDDSDGSDDRVGAVEDDHVEHGFSRSQAACLVEAVQALIDARS